MRTVDFVFTWKLWKKVSFDFILTKIEAWAKIYEKDKCFIRVENPQDMVLPMVLPNDICVMASRGAGVAEWVRRQAITPRVFGSNPTYQGFFQKIDLLYAPGWLGTSQDKADKTSPGFNNNHGFEHHTEVLVRGRSSYLKLILMRWEERLLRETVGDVLR